jgi:hypothetical protein
VASVEVILDQMPKNFKARKAQLTVRLATKTWTSLRRGYAEFPDWKEVKEAKFWTQSVYAAARKTLRGVAARSRSSVAGPNSEVKMIELDKDGKVLQVPHHPSVGPLLKFREADVFLLELGPEDELEAEIRRALREKNEDEQLPNFLLWGDLQSVQAALAEINAVGRATDGHLVMIHQRWTQDEPPYTVKLQGMKGRNRAAYFCAEAEYQPFYNFTHCVDAVPPVPARHRDLFLLMSQTASLSARRGSWRYGFSSCRTLHGLPCKRS